MICKKAIMSELKSISILCVAALSLSACIPGDAKKQSRSYDPSSFASSNARSCLRELKSEKVSFQSLPNKNYGGGCRAHDAVRLLNFGTPTTNLGPMTCTLANGFTDWTRDVVRPAARKYLGSSLAKIETSGTYSCRKVSGSGRLSQHAHANAVDVFAFRFANDRRITVQNGWNGSRDEQRFLRHIQDEACGRFGTVLGPQYNRQHADHFHLDMAPSRLNGNPFCR